MSQAVNMASLEAAPADIPGFPLPHVLPFPRARPPPPALQPPYRPLLKDCVATHGVMVVANVPDPHDTDEHGRPKIALVAGAGTIIENQALADGRSNILLHGIARLRLEELPFVPPYRRAKGTILHE